MYFYQLNYYIYIIKIKNIYKIIFFYKIKIKN